ncbi:ankyrin repeats family protein [Piscirickettsia salmonis]|uniref:Ankyrin repeats (3 copies) n=1 Tax=Piscirickettsia salmonis TaxID=1238 RepID=A0A9Q5YGP6_PISSA|nr:ankyrin repeats family protein [Piscirickettsia salmonis]APS56009.1 ankryin [Piscirickettsia salmonis]ERL62524.1 ankyrin repeats family protein [Piscirickettsia salmonis LF-89 = ATCC VR-1361]PEQ16061.1 ankryin [Piscirickettsia salmonis]QGN77268.1 Ankyrin repeats (3 copies) [Piscirickettsia salmonis]QGN80833.1 Ankyrin repeats (3 copies) [Piscirickettsia salmonis]
MPGTLGKEIKDPTRSLFNALKSSDPSELARIPEYLRLNANPNTLFHYKRLCWTTAMGLAIKLADPELVELLLAVGGDPAKGIKFAPWLNDDEATESILATIDVILKFSKFKAAYIFKGALLAWAVGKNRIDIAEKALKMGASPDSYYYYLFHAGISNYSSIDWAVKLEHRGSIPLLLRYGGRLNLEMYQENGERNVSILDYAQRRCDREFYDFLLKEQQEYAIERGHFQSGAALDVSSYGQVLPSALKDLTISFLTGDTAVKAEKCRRQVLWARLCDDLTIGFLNEGKSKALYHYRFCELNKEMLGSFLTVAAQRRHRGGGETTSLCEICHLFKKENNSFILGILGVTKDQVTPNNLRSIARYGDIDGQLISEGKIKKEFLPGRIRKEDYASTSQFFEAIANTEQGRVPHFIFHDHHNVIEEHDRAQTLELT